MRRGDQPSKSQVAKLAKVGSRKEKNEHKLIAAGKEMCAAVCALFLRQKDISGLVSRRCKGCAPRKATEVHVATDVTESTKGYTRDCPLGLAFESSKLLQLRLNIAFDVFARGTRNA